MDTERAWSRDPCGKCCECFLPVRCVIDQHEVEIIPASARSSASNDYTMHGGSSLDSTSRTALGSSSYRQQQYQQLSQRAAAVGSTRSTGVFFPSHRGSASSLQAHELASYRSAASSELFSENSRQASWDSKSPRVPLINLRKIMQHGAAIPSSPVDSERLATVQQTAGWLIGANWDKCASPVSASDESLTSSERESSISEEKTSSEMLSAPLGDFDGTSFDPTEADSTCGHEEFIPIATFRDALDSVSSCNSSTSSSKQEQVTVEKDAALDVQCFALAASRHHLQPRPGEWLMSRLEASSWGAGQGKWSDEGECTTHRNCSSGTHEEEYGADSFPLLGMDFLCVRGKGRGFSLTWGPRRTRAMEVPTAGAMGAAERHTSTSDESPVVATALKPDDVPCMNNVEGVRVRPAEQEAGSPAVSTSVGPVSSASDYDGASNKSCAFPHSDREPINPLGLSCPGEAVVHPEFVENVSQSVM